MKEKREYKDRIVLDPTIHFGKPCIAGTRIPVEDVLELAQEGITFKEIVVKYYPDLQIEDIKACVKYATDLVKEEEVHIGVAQVRLLADQDVWKATLDLLRDWGHDLVTAKDVGMARASDEELLMQAKRDGRVFITRDKGYGSLVFLSDVPCPGVVLLRITPGTMNEVHAQLDRVFQEHTEEQMQQCFCTVEPKRHRIRRIATS